MADNSDILLEHWKEQRTHARQCENQRATFTNLVLLLASAGLGFLANRGLEPFPDLSFDDVYNPAKAQHAAHRKLMSNVRLNSIWILLNMMIAMAGLILTIAILATST